MAKPNPKVNPSPPKPDPKNPLAQRPDDEVLAYAWELYETYSKGSQKQKESNSAIRQTIIKLIFATSVLAVITTLPGMSWVLSNISQYIQNNWGWLGWGIPIISRYGLSAALIVLSVATTSLLSYASQFTPLRAWIMYRVGADRIRSEIYLYRLSAAHYAEFPNDSYERRKEFLKRIEEINRQIYELETAPPFLQLEGKDKDTYELSQPRKILSKINNIRRLRPKQAVKEGVVTRPDSKVLHQGETPKRLSGRYFIEHDNGFNPITIEDYIDYRVVPQRDWYVKKVYEDYEKIKDWRQVILYIGGGSAVLAAVQLEPYIVITTAAVVAVNTHIQLNLIGSNYGNYHITASRIDSELVTWRNLPKHERNDPKVVSEFVTRMEQIFEDERTVWMQQASQAQQESEQTLIKGASKRAGEPSLLVERGLITPDLARAMEQGGGPSNGTTTKGEPNHDTMTADKNTTTTS